MDKIEKLLGISVTAEMVAEQLTEQEIIEIQEELEEELNSIDNVIEISQGEKGYHQNKMKKHESAIADLDSKLKVDTQRKNLYTKVNENLKSALTLKKQGIEAKFKSGDKVVFTKSEEGLFKSGDVGVVKSSLNAYGRYIYHVETSECAFISAEEHEMELRSQSMIKMVDKEGQTTSRLMTQNERRSKLISEAKEYISEHEDVLRAVVNKSECSVRIIDGGYYEESFRYPNECVWNKHIVKAYGMARLLANYEAVSKFGEQALQPTEIVEGMDVELLDKDGYFLLSGRVAEFNKTSDTVKLSEIYESMDSGIIKEFPVHRVTKHGYHISGDTKAKYGDGDE